MKDAGAEEVVIWSNLLRLVDQDGAERRALLSNLRLSKRVVKTSLAGLERHGWATVDGGVVHLTEVARHTRDEWANAITAAESRWHGATSVRAPLEAVVSQLPLEHPHYPCGYGTADWRITGGPGVDWKAAHRDPAVDTVTSSWLLALLAQALVGFAVEYESRVPFALLVGVHFDARFADGPVPLSEVPRFLGIAGNGKSSLEGHGAVAVDGANPGHAHPARPSRA